MDEAGGELRNPIDRRDAGEEQGAGIDGEVVGAATASTEVATAVGSDDPPIGHPRKAPDHDQQERTSALEENNRGHPIHSPGGSPMDIEGSPMDVEGSPMDIDSPIDSRLPTYLDDDQGVPESSGRIRDEASEQGRAGSGRGTLGHQPVETIRSTASIGLSGTSQDGFSQDDGDPLIRELERKAERQRHVRREERWRTLGPGRTEEDPEDELELHLDSTLGTRNHGRRGRYRAALADDDGYDGQGSQDETVEDAARVSPRRPGKNRRRRGKEVKPEADEEGWENPLEGRFGVRGREAAERARMGNGQGVGRARERQHTGEAGPGPSTMANRTAADPSSVRPAFIKPSPQFDNSDAENDFPSASPRFRLPTRLTMRPQFASPSGIGSIRRYTVGAAQRATPKQNQESPSHLAPAKGLFQGFLSTFKAMGSWGGLGEHPVTTSAAAQIPNGQDRSSGHRSGTDIDSRDIVDDADGYTSSDWDFPRQRTVRIHRSKPRQGQDISSPVARNRRSGRSGRARGSRSAIATDSENNGIDGVQTTSLRSALTRRDEAIDADSLTDTEGYQTGDKSPVIGTRQIHGHRPSDATHSHRAYHGKLMSAFGMLSPDSSPPASLTDAPVRPAGCGVSSQQQTGVYLRQSGPVVERHPGDTRDGQTSQRRPQHRLLRAESVARSETKRYARKEKTAPPTRADKMKRAAGTILSRIRKRWESVKNRVRTKQRRQTIRYLYKRVSQDLHHTGPVQCGEALISGKEGTSIQRNGTGTSAFAHNSSPASPPGCLVETATPERNTVGPQRVTTQKPVAQATQSQDHSVTSRRGSNSNDSQVTSSSSFAKGNPIFSLASARRSSEAETEPLVEYDPQVQEEESPEDPDRAGSGGSGIHSLLTASEDESHTIENICSTSSNDSPPPHSPPRVSAQDVREDQHCTEAEVPDAVLPQPHLSTLGRSETVDASRQKPPDAPNESDDWEVGELTGGVQAGGDELQVVQKPCDSDSELDRPQDGSRRRRRFRPLLNPNLVYRSTQAPYPRLRLLGGIDTGPSGPTGTVKRSFLPSGEVPPGRAHKHVPAGERIGSWVAQAVPASLRARVTEYPNRHLNAYRFTLLDKAGDARVWSVVRLQPEQMPAEILNTTFQYVSSTHHVRNFRLEAVPHGTILARTELQKAARATVRMWKRFGLHRVRTEDLDSVLVTDDGTELSSISDVRNDEMMSAQCRMEETLLAIEGILLLRRKGIDLSLRLGILLFTSTMFHDEAERAALELVGDGWIGQTLSILVAHKYWQKDDLTAYARGLSATQLYTDEVKSWESNQEMYYALKDTSLFRYMRRGINGCHTLPAAHEKWMYLVDYPIPGRSAWKVYPDFVEALLAAAQATACGSSMPDLQQFDFELAARFLRFIYPELDQRDSICFSWDSSGLPGKSETAGHLASTARAKSMLGLPDHSRDRRKCILLGMTEPTLRKPHIRNDRSVFLRSYLELVGEKVQKATTQHRTVLLKRPSGERLLTASESHWKIQAELHPDRLAVLLWDAGIMGLLGEEVDQYSTDLKGRYMALLGGSYASDPANTAVPAVAHGRLLAMDDFSRVDGGAY